jgi:hypothetical protein
MTPNTNMMRIPVPAPVMGTPREYLDMMKAKRATVANLCRALEEYLSCELNQTIAALDQPEGIPTGPRVTLEHLEQSQASVEQLQARLEKMRAEMDAMPDHLREAIAPAYEGIMFPMIERELKDATAWRDMIQKQLESQEVK